MKVTFILKDLSKAFYEGSNILGIPGLNNLPSDGERFDYLIGPRCRDLKISRKTGNDSTRDAVEFNQLIRAQRQSGVPTTPKAYKLEPRKGYKLATFEF
jgi:hypothetical protein